MRDFNTVVDGFTLILSGLGVPDNDHTRDTARRAAKAWWDELCRGLTHEAPKVTTFESKVESMIVVRNIPVQSICAHHLLPFVGEATIAYIPGGGRILGVSKLSRLTDYYSRRPQVQEELTEQIADAIAEQVMPKGETGFGNGGVGVMIRANHFCMQLRGVRHRGEMVTSALRGCIRHEAAARAEFLQLIKEPT